MEILRMENIKKEVEDRALFSIPLFSLNLGDKVGLIGNNGVGKTTLLRILTGEDERFHGTVRRYGAFAYVPQLKEQCDESGGEQVLHSLKSALAEEKELLLLDEPTANLDAENVEWLIQKIRSYRGTVLMVSHDRFFLNRTADHIYLLESEGLTHYSGNYDDFKAQREKERLAQEAEYEQYVQKKKRLIEAVEEKKSKAKNLTKKKKNVSSSDWKVNSKMGSYDGQAKSLSKVAKAIESRIEKMEKVEKPEREKFVKFRASELPRRTGTLFHLREGCVRLEDRLLFEFPALKMSFGDKAVITGRNKVGKTTFLNRIFRQELDGYYADGLKMAYFRQDMSSLDEAKSIFENVSGTCRMSPTTIFNTLAILHLDYYKTRAPVGKISGGERILVQLAKVLLSDAELILLDEPTNYLDISAMEALEKFLRDDPKSYLIVSHDSAFIRNLSAKRYEIEDFRMREMTE